MATAHDQFLGGGWGTPFARKRKMPESQKASGSARREFENEFDEINDVKCAKSLAMPRPGLSLK